MIKYACNHTRDYCPGRELSDRGLCWDCKQALIGQVVEFVRFGAPPECGRSYNYATNQAEAGVSGYLMIDGQIYGTIRSEFADRQRYVGRGVVVGIGSDDEIVVDIIEISKSRRRKI